MFFPDTAEYPAPSAVPWGAPVLAGRGIEAVQHTRRAPSERKSAQSFPTVAISK